MIGKTIIRLPDGQEISSGSPGVAVKNIQVVHSVNEGPDLRLGSCCASMLIVTIMDPGRTLDIAEGAEIEYRIDTVSRALALIGKYTVGKPTRAGNTLKIVGYDRITWLDRDLSAWINSLQGWPYRLRAFAQMVCQQCGLELTDTQFLNEAYPVQQITGTGITGRQLMRWIAEIGGGFAFARPDGQIEIGWYTDSGATIAPTGDTYYYGGGLKAEEYTVAPIDKVQIQLTDDDVGTVWPANPAGTNTYRITGNRLLSNLSADNLQAVAEQLYERLRTVTYTPMKVSRPADLRFWRAGYTVTVRDISGREITAYVMTSTRNGSKRTLTCTGSPRRDSVAAVNHQSIRQLHGKMLELRTDVDGLRVANRDMSGNMAQLELDLDSIRSTVQAQGAETAGQIADLASQIRQAADSVTVELSRIRTEGVEQVITRTGYRFDIDGLKIGKSGSPIDNRIDNTGVYVERSGEPMLTANDAGVEATDLKARNYLIIGQNSRLEDYRDSKGRRQTACFAIGGD